MADFLPPIQVRTICRTCGALCSREVWEDNGGLCNRCAAPVRVKTPPAERDPIHDAIDRAAANWSDDNPE
jgi:hypothetical protein